MGGWRTAPLGMTRTSRSGGARAVEFLERERRTAELTAPKRPTGPPEPDGHPVIIELGDRCGLVLQVSRADVAVKHDGVPRQNCAMAVADRTVCSNSRRACTASAIATRC